MSDAHPLDSSEKPGQVAAGDAFVGAHPPSDSSMELVGGVQKHLGAASHLVEKLAKIEVENQRLIGPLRDERDRLQRQVETVSEELYAARQSAEEAKGEVRSLRKELEDLRTQLALAERRTPVHPKVPAFKSVGLVPESLPTSSEGSLSRPDPDSAPPSDPPTAVDTFVAWCQRGGGLVGNAEAFGRALDNAVCGARVVRLYRDADSPVRPVRLAESMGVSPIEFWGLVQDGSVSVVPHPMGPGQFRELAPIFRGAATPDSVRVLRPPTVRRAGDGYVVGSPGAIE